MEHKHHIIPKHSGGTDDETNIVYLTIEEHAEAHRLLFEKYGKLEDYLAWKGLCGQMGKEEILKEIYKENGKRFGKNNKGRIPWNKGKTKNNDERLKRQSNNMKGAVFSEEHRENLKKAAIGKDTSNMGKHERTQEIREKNRIAAKKQFSTEESRKVHSERQKNNRDICPHCGMESTKFAITRHIRIRHSNT